MKKPKSPIPLPKVKLSQPIDTVLADMNQKIVKAPPNDSPLWDAIGEYLNPTKFSNPADLLTSCEGGLSKFPWSNIRPEANRVAQALGDAKCPDCYAAAAAIATWQNKTGLTYEFGKFQNHLSSWRSIGGFLGFKPALPY